jgi:tRNA (guanine-N7-)-methyltransferase
MSLERKIKSYVIRAKKFNQAKQDYFDEQKSLYNLDPELINNLPTNTKTNILDIGFGEGESILSHCRNYPDSTIVGFEVYNASIYKLFLELGEVHRDHLFICNDDVSDYINNFKSDTFDKVTIFFPDPWPKKRHNKRRLVNLEFMKKLCAVMRKNGVIHIATDILDYATQAEDVCASIPNLTKLYGDDAAFHTKQRQPSKYSKKAENPINDMVWLWK